MCTHSTYYFRLQQQPFKFNKQLFIAQVSSDKDKWEDISHPSSFNIARQHIKMFKQTILNPTVYEETWEPSEGLNILFEEATTVSEFNTKLQMTKDLMNAFLNSTLKPDKDAIKAQTTSILGKPIFNFIDVD